MLTAGALVHPLRGGARRASRRSRARYRKTELFEGGIARGVTLAPVNTVADVLALEQLAVRDYWDELRLPSGRTLRGAGAVREGVGARRSAWRRPAPDVGEHTREVLDALAAAAAAAAPARRAGRSASPSRSKA